MLTTKNWRALLLPAARSDQARRPAGLGHAKCFVALALAGFVAFVLSGCSPAGPRALLDGERFLKDGKYPQAIKKLEAATRALPANAQAWNHLGLAYHKAGQPAAALKAYEHARRIDLNLTPVRYNLGCLLLEENNPQAAIAELTAYTLLERDSVDGWLKLGTAQLRARQFDNAERSFQSVLRLKPNSAEAWNSLGLIQAQRKRTKEALNCFNLALQKQSDYPPAILNLAILNHYYLSNRPVALDNYREYLELDPTSPNSSSVKDNIRQLQTELANAARNQVPDPKVLPPSTQTIAQTYAPSTPRTVLSQVVTQSAAVASSPPVVSAPVAKPQPKPTDAMAAAERPPSTLQESPRRPDPEAIKNTPPPPAVSEPPPVVEPAPKPSQAEVVQLAEDPPPRVAQDEVTRAPAPRDSVTVVSPLPVNEPAGEILAEQQSDAASPETATEEKVRPFERFNPKTWFRGKRRPTAGDSMVGNETKSGTALNGTSSMDRGASLPGVSSPRYAYASPAKPAPGDRLKAQSFFATAVQAHRDRRLNEAMKAYHEAIRLDPAFFEAHYNLGLAAFEDKDYQRSLSAYETALSLNPTSSNARYNFALALEQAGYIQDAATEYQAAIATHPHESRAHLSLARLYADKLSKPELARLHYRRVLELEPQHPQASAIRFWLAANP